MRFTRFDSAHRIRVHIDHVQPSQELTTSSLFPSIVSELLAGRPSTILCLDAGGDSASWLLGKETAN